MDKTVTTTYEYEGHSYPATITYKRMRSLRMRMDKSGQAILVSCPKLTSRKTIDSFVNRNLGKLLGRVKRKNRAAYGEDWMYIWGEKAEIGFADDKKRKTYIKKNALPIFEERVRLYEGIMGVKPPYKVRLRFMETRYGSNSAKTHSIAISAIFFHFPIEILDALIVHELAHHFQRNHGPNFYKVVYRYCPDYNRRMKLLRERKYEGTPHQ
ncbi:MAG: DUF45 domain-containing protein [Bacillota bacterium]|nr:DUF45 domain-containing protein [Bacillota bacterium]